MVKIIQRRVKHAKVLPCVFFIPLRMRVRDNIIILYTEVDSKRINHSQSLYFKGIPSLVPPLSQGILFITIRDSKPISKPLTPFISKTFSGYQLIFSPFIFHQKYLGWFLFFIVMQIINAFF